MFVVAFYGCLLAEVIPVPIEVPLTRKVTLLTLRRRWSVLTWRAWGSCIVGFVTILETSCFLKYSASLAKNMKAVEKLMTNIYNFHANNIYSTEIEYLQYYVSLKNHGGTLDFLAITIYKEYHPRFRDYSQSTFAVGKVFCCQGIWFNCIF